MFDSSALRLREDDYDGKGGDDHVANNITESDEAFSDIRVGLEHAKRAIG